MINQNFKLKIQSLSNFKFIIFSFFISFIYLAYNLLLGLIFNTSNSSSLIILNSIPLIFYSIFLAPFIETFIFQFIIIKLSKKIFKNYFWGIIISALIFNISHNFSLWNHIAFIPISLFFPYIFYVYDEIDKNPILRLTFIHFSVNLVLILFCKLF